MHRLVQVVVRDSLGDSACAYGDAVCAATAAHVPDPVELSLAPSAWTPWLPHIAAVVSMLEGVVRRGTGVDPGPGTPPRDPRRPAQGLQ